MSDENDSTRRQFVHLTGVTAALALAGCSGDGGDGGGGDAVPAEYETATAQDGTGRNPDSLSSKEAVNYQDEPKGGEQCSGCNFYIPDKNGDGQGACAIVAGEIAPDGWCASYVSYDG